MSSIIHAFVKCLHIFTARIGGDLDDTCQVHRPQATMAANQTVSQKYMVDFGTEYIGGKTV
jgi:hypothetical protein